MPRLVAILLIPIILLADQLSKWWVIERFFRPRLFEAQEAGSPFMTWLTTLSQKQFPSVRYEVFEYFNLVMVWNKGISFGMLSSDTTETRIFLIVSALLLVTALLVWMWKKSAWMTTLPLAMIIAGALANIWDRIRFGGVADFLDFHIGDLHYPAFNIADSAIVLGVIWLAFDGLILEAKRLKKNDSTE